MPKKPLAEMSQEELIDEIKILNEIIEQPNAEVEKLQKKVSDQQDIIKDLKEKVKSESKKATGNKKFVKDAEGNKHEMTVDKFSFNRAEHTHESLSDNPEMVSEMVEKGVGFLVAVN